MSPVSAVVLYAVIWFLTIFLVLPVRLRTQGDEGRIVPGTHAGAPADFRLGRTVLIVTLAATVVWALVVGFVLYSGIGVRDIDIFDRMGPAPD